MKRPLHRRSVLRGLGAAITLPWLSAMAPRAAAKDSVFKPWQQSVGTHPRLICCYIPNGVNIQQWVPAGSGKDYPLSPTLEGLARHRENVAVLSGLGHPASQGGHSGADTWLTGADLTSVPGSDYTNSLSIDQLVAAQLGTHTRFSSLQASDQSGTGSAGHSHTLSFDRNGTPLPAENSPKRVFERLFIPDSLADREATLQRYAQRKSILDSVLEEAKSLNRQLDREDQQKLGEYLSGVRETEQRIERLEAWVDVPKPQVADKDLQLNSQPGNAHDRGMWLDVMLELSYLAMTTDMSRVITFEWSREAGGFGGGGENHHELSHHGGDEGMLNKLAEIDRFHVAKLARFMDLLQATEEADGSMLDRTVILFGSGMNSGLGGEHSPKNLPLLIGGGRQLGLELGQHLAFDPDQHPPLSSVLLSVAQAVGCETDQFSDATSRLTGL